MLDSLVGRFKRAIKVFLLFNYLILQGLVLLLDAFDEDVGEFAHVP